MYVIVYVFAMLVDGRRLYERQPMQIQVSIEAGVIYSLLLFLYLLDALALEVIVAGHIHVVVRGW